MLHVTRFEHLGVTLLYHIYTFVLFYLGWSIPYILVYFLKDDQLKQLGTLAKTRKWKTMDI